MFFCFLKKTPWYLILWLVLVLFSGTESYTYTWKYFRKPHVLNLRNSTAQYPLRKDGGIQYKGATLANAPKCAIACIIMIGGRVMPPKTNLVLKHLSCITVLYGHRHLNRWYTTSFVFPVCFAWCSLYITQSVCGLNIVYCLGGCFYFVQAVCTGYIKRTCHCKIVCLMVISLSENIIYVKILFKNFLS